MIQLDEDGHQRVASILQATAAPLEKDPIGYEHKARKVVKSDQCSLDLWYLAETGRRIEDLCSGCARLAIGLCEANEALNVLNERK